MGYSIDFSRFSTPTGVGSLSKMIKKYGRVKQAEVRGCKWIPGRPTRYAIKVCYDYDTQGNEKTKWIIASGKFAKKYERETAVQGGQKRQPDILPP